MTWWTSPEHITPWPLRHDYRPRRVLARWDGETIVDEHDDFHPAKSVKEVYRAAFTRNLLILVKDIAETPWLEEAVCNPHCIVIADSNDRPTMVRLEGHPYYRCIVEDDSWGTSDLAAIRQCLDAGQVGDHPTAGAWGAALMRASWTAETPLVRRPTEPLWRLLKAQAVGGRADLWQRGRRFGQLYEVDRNMSYPASAQWTPAGTPVRDIREGGAVGYYYVKWRATPLHPLAVRQDNHLSSWDQEEAENWQWSPTIAAARARGAVVEVRHGYHWPALSPVLGDWSRRMHNLRWQVSNPVPVKQAAVAAIGRFASDRQTRRLVPGGEGMRPAIDHRYDVLEQFHEHADALIHLWSYIVDQSNLALLVQMERESQQDLVGSNYDAYYTTKQPTWTGTKSLGEWKWTTLHDAALPGLRQLESREKMRMLGHDAL